MANATRFSWQSYSSEPRHAHHGSACSNFKLLSQHFIRPTTREPISLKSTVSNHFLSAGLLSVYSGLNQPLQAGAERRKRAERERRARMDQLFHLGVAVFLDPGIGAASAADCSSVLLDTLLTLRPEGVPHTARGFEGVDALYFGGSHL